MFIYRMYYFQVIEFEELHNIENNVLISACDNMELVELHANLTDAVAEFMVQGRKIENIMNSLF